MRDRHVLIRGGTIVTMNTYRDVLENQDILVVGDRIAAIGHLRDRDQDVDEVIPADGRIVTPGLIQTHTHLTQTLFRNLVADRALDAWLDVILRLEAAHDRDSNFWSAMLGIAELFLGGTTAIYDFEATHFTDSCFEAIERTGIRAFAGKRMVDRQVPGVQIPAALIQPTDVAFGESVALFERWDGRDGGRIRYCFAPGSALDCTKRLLQLTADFSARHGARVHIHVSETEGEVRLSLELNGMREIPFLDSIGLINPRTVCAHCVHLNSRDIGIMARRGAHVAHCPTANLYLASGIAPIPTMIRRGVSIGLGADAAADNNNLDAFLEMRLAASLQKGLHMDPTIQPTAQKTFELATLGGARSLGLEQEIGSIEVGKQADLIILDLRKPHTWPNEPEVNAAQNIYTRIIYSAKAADVVMTMVNGRVVMRDRTLLTMDINEVLRESNTAIRRLLRRSGVTT